MNLESPFMWVAGAIGLGYLIAQFLIFVLVIYALENGKIDLSSLIGSRTRALKLINLVFGLGFGFLILSSIFVSASRQFLEGNHDLVPFVFTVSSLVFLVLLAFIVKLFK